MCRRNRTILWSLFMLMGIMGALALLSGGSIAHAADSAPVATLNIHVHLRFRPFWLDYNPPHSRYFATLDVCVEPDFTVVKSSAYDFGNCIILQDAKPGYAPISVPADNAYIQAHDITYWTQTIQVIMPDQFAHTLHLYTNYVFHDIGQTGPDGKAAILSSSAVLRAEITVSSSDPAQVVPMDGSIPPTQYLHFVFHPVGAYDHHLSFWGCLRRPAPGQPSAYCGLLAPVSDGSFQLDAKMTTPPDPTSLFGPTTDPVLDGTNIQLTIVAAPSGQELPDAQPAPTSMAGHPANQIVAPAGSPIDCAAASGLVYADQTLECSAAIKHDTGGQDYLAPTQVRTYVGFPPSAASTQCVVCTTTKPWPYAGPVFLALLLIALGGGGAVILMYLGRVPLATNRPLVRNPIFVGSAAFALISFVFLVGGAMHFKIGYQPVVPGKMVMMQTPGAGSVDNAVPPTPTFTASPTPTSTSTPAPIPTHTPGVGPSPTP